MCPLRIPISVPIRGLVLSLALSASSFAATTLGLFLATRSLLISWTLSSQLDVTNITMLPCTVHYAGITRLLRSYFILLAILRSLPPISRHLSTPQPSAISPAGSRVQKPKPSRIMIPKVLMSCTLTVFMHACMHTDIIWICRGLPLAAGEPACSSPSGEDARSPRNWGGPGNTLDVMEQAERHSRHNERHTHQLHEFR